MHCAEIERCNQRGGRMLSVVDLIDAGTLSRELAAYSLAALGSGASFMVGALPGGAGKTTVMGALLNFVPPGVRLLPADGERAVEEGLRKTDEKRCYICHEIGSGPYYAYLWGKALRLYFKLPAAGHMIATNLHADTHEQARDQVCGENRVPVEAFRRVPLLYFLGMARAGWNYKRRIASVWESDGEEAHRQVFGADISTPLSRTTRIVSAERLDAACKVVDTIMASGARTIEDVRTAIVEDTT